MLYAHAHQAKQEEEQHRAQEEAKKRQEAARKREEEAAQRRSVACLHPQTQGLHSSNLDIVLEHCRRASVSMNFGYSMALYVNWKCLTKPMQ